jgi:hypothetical protein
MARFLRTLTDPDGTAYFEGVNERSSLQFTVRPDGSHDFDKEVVGFCRFCWEAELAGEDVCPFPGSPHGDRLIKAARAGTVLPVNAPARPVVATDGVPAASTSEKNAEDSSVTVDDEPIARVVELKPPSSPDVERMARIVAKDVWALGAGVAIPMGKLSARHQRPDAVVAPLVGFGVDQGWLVVDAQDQVRRGPTSPIPMTDIPDVDGPAWGPGEPIGTEPDDPVDVWHRLVPGTRTTRIRTS